MEKKRTKKKENVSGMIGYVLKGEVVYFFKKTDFSLRLINEIERLERTTSNFFDPLVDCCVNTHLETFG